MNPNTSEAGRTSAATTKKYHAAKYRWRDKNQKWAWVISAVQRARQRARASGVPCDIDGKYLMSITKDRCPVFGFEFNWSGNRKALPSSPTLDKIIPSKGYVRGNVAVISNKANTIKSAYDADALRTVADWLDMVSTRSLTSYRSPGKYKRTHGEPQMVPNTFQVPKYIWVKWREAGQLVYNDLVSNGINEKTAARRAVEASDKAIALDIKRGPLPEEAPVELKAPPTEENEPQEAPVAPKPATKTRRKVEVTK